MITHDYLSVLLAQVQQLRVLLGVHDVGVVQCHLLSTTDHVIRTLDSQHQRVILHRNT